MSVSFDLLAAEYQSGYISRGWWDLELDGLACGLLVDGAWIALFDVYLMLFLHNLCRSIAKQYGVRSSYYDSLAHRNFCGERCFCVYIYVCIYVLLVKIVFKNSERWFWWGRRILSLGGCLFFLFKLTVGGAVEGVIGSPSVQVCRAGLNAVKRGEGIFVLKIGNCVEREMLIWGRGTDDWGLGPVLGIGSEAAWIRDRGVMEWRVRFCTWWNGRLGSLEVWIAIS